MRGEDGGETVFTRKSDYFCGGERDWEYYGPGFSARLIAGGKAPMVRAVGGVPSWGVPRQLAGRVAAGEPIAHLRSERIWDLVSGGMCSSGGRRPLGRPLRALSE